MSSRIAAYAPTLHARAGDTVPVHASGTAGKVWAQLVQVRSRIGSADGWNACPVASSRLGPFPLVDAPIRKGSWLSADLEVSSADLHFRCLVWRAHAHIGRGTVVALVGASTTLALEISDDDELALRRGYELSELALFLRPNHWYEIDLWLDTSHGQVRVTTVDRLTGESTTTNTPMPAEDLGVLERLVVAGVPGRKGVTGDLDAKIEGPRLTRGDEDQPVAAWDLAALPYSDVLPDTTGHGRDAVLANGPLRGVTGSAWRGQSTDFRKAPHLYGAAAFHRTDLSDADWPRLCELEVPTGTPPGVYCLVVSVDADPDFSDPESYFPVPVFVVGQSPNDTDVALVLPTMSYRAYANNGFYKEADPATYVRRGPTTSTHVYDYIESQDLLSLYGHHSDGSGVHLATLRRPQATVRPDWVSQLLGTPHQLSADLEIVEWLDHAGVSWTLLTDEVLHEQGASALAGTKAVITGSHPEYSTEQVLNAYDEYVADGGSLMYMGGNGFILKVEVDPLRPWLQELRRGDNGGDIWASSPGEMHHQISGELGGLWRRQGRPPNVLTGLGFSAMGFSGDGAYRLPDDLDDTSLPPRTRIALGALSGREFGIAGLELDCHDEALGSPPGTVKLAVLSSLPEDYLPVPEYRGTSPGAVRCRADVALRRTPAGGWVFAAGSIGWTSQINTKGDPTAVNRLTSAVLHDILDE